MQTVVDLRAVSESQHVAKIAETKSMYTGIPILAIKHTPVGDREWEQNNRIKLVHFIHHGQGYHNLLGQVSPTMELSSLRLVNMKWL
jgi:hypothetical protein